jgi:hypothetical protein
VPSVLLMIAAGKLANTDRFMAGFWARRQRGVAPLVRRKCGSAAETDRLELVAAVAADPLVKAHPLASAMAGSGRVTVEKGHTDQQGKDGGDDHTEGRQVEDHRGQGH